MTGALAQERYAGRYPLQGRVAVLCEGDFAGYEADLLARLTAPYGYVDVWPCGTKTAIVGMTDAIGRTVPIVVIEDRDFRTQEQAAAECEKKRKDRVEKRGVRMHAWKTWRRNEIENYLIEPAIVAPALAQAFDAEEGSVRTRLEALLPELVVDQAAAWTIAQFQVALPDPHQYVPGLPRGTARPKWNGGNPAVVAPEPATVREKLESTLSAQLKAFDEKGATLSVATLMSDFDAKCEKWSQPSLDSQAWRTDWSGKEVLEWLCRWLAADYGWPTDAGAGRQPVRWDELPADRARALDREVAWTLQRYLVAALSKHLESQPTDEITTEWRGIAECIGAATRGRTDPAGRPSS